MKAVFYTISDDKHWEGARGDEFVKSFKHFHPGIDLEIFREDRIRKVFTKYPGLSFYNSKAAFAKELYNDYDLIVNIDNDHLILGRLDSILAADYEVACPGTFNTCANITINVNTETDVLGTNAIVPAKFIPDKGYFQGGLIASTCKEFWDTYHEASMKHSHNFAYKENDVLNMVLHLLDYKTKYLEGHPDYRHRDFHSYYGCDSLGSEKDAYVEDGQIKLYGKPIKAYHFAWGGPAKKHPRELFSKEVCDFIYTNIVKP